MKKKVLGICGSLRSKSLNRALLAAAFDTLGDRVTTEIADIGALPHYNGELDGDDKPAAVRKLIAQIEGADAVLIATPEYNYSFPGVLKNAIDWASRPAYRSCLAHKPVALIGASNSAVGTARAQAQLRQVLAGTLSPVLAHPDFLVGAAASKFDGEGRLTDEPTRQHLEKFAAALLAWLD